MKNLFLTLLLFISSVNIGYAAGTPLACIKKEVGGLVFEEGKWKTVAFKFDPQFILILDENGLITAASASKALSPKSDYPDSYVCNRYFKRLFCSDKDGSYSITLHSEKLTGSIVKASGNTVWFDPEDRDTMSIAPFSCQKF